MATMAPRSLKIGTIIDKTLGVLEYNTAAALIYVAVLSIITGALTYFTADITAPTTQMGVGLAKFVVGISAAYLLLDAMLRKTGLRSPTDEDAFLPYLALSILYTLGVLAGFLLIVFPGLLIMARWSIAQPMVVVRGGGVKQALGESWERTRGMEIQILVAAFALLLVPIVVIIAGSSLIDQASPVGIAVSQLASNATSVISLAMGVALYGLIDGGRTASRAA